LSYIASPYLGRLFEIIIGHRISDGWIATCPECWSGFYISFVLFSFLLFSTFLEGKKRFYYALGFGLALPILALLGRDGNIFLVSLGAGVIGLGLGQVVYLIRKKVQK